MKLRRKNKIGYTLIEVMVAASIFGMVIVGGISGVRMGFHIVDNSRHYTRVSQILQSEVESLRSLSWADLNQLPDNELVNINAQFSTSVYDDYAVRRRIYTESTTLRRVEIAVAYKTRSGNPVTLKYITFFTKGGVNDYYYRAI